jgi:CRISPR-associated endoribonuclease Cas6
MHLTIEFTSENNIVLPIHYNHLVQAFIYKTIDEKLADFLHKTGYGSTRKFKLFSFSNLLGSSNVDILKGEITFNRQVALELSSPISDFCESFANGIIKKTLKIGNNKLETGSIKIDKQVVRGEQAVLKTLSPVTVYSTLYKAERKKYTCYFQPGEEDFRRIAEENLRKKFRAYTGTEPPAGEIEIFPKSQPRLHIIKYKGFIIKGYTGNILIKGPNELIQMAVDSGLGSKNSQGFGCVKIIR